MRGVILAGGFGSRMSPISKVINKHLLPVYSTKQGAVPMLYYPINTLVRSGISDILIITSDEAAGLIIETMGDGKKFGSKVDFTYKIQNMHDPLRPCGIASALSLSRHFVGDEPFTVILGDNFYENEFSFDFNNFSKSRELAHVFLKEVYDPERFGVATIENNKIISIIEKPKHSVSKLAVTGLYLYKSSVFSIIDELKPSERNELEVSDVNATFLSSGDLCYSKIAGFWRDMGVPFSMRETEDFINKVEFRHEFSKDLQ